MPIASVSPISGETLRTFPADTPEQVSGKLDQAVATFRTWSARPIAKRAEVLRAAGGLLDGEADRLAAIATTEMGKTLRAAHDEVTKCAATCRYYAEQAEAFLRPDPVAGPDEAVWFQPLGAVLAVMPWNFPYWQVVRFVAPALAAGNVA
jgi:succinate-semialdehyde dehydrogenase/glutarate-semialdehyde dehydrogenase